MKLTISLLLLIGILNFSSIFCDSGSQECGPINIADCPYGVDKVYGPDGCKWVCAPSPCEVNIESNKSVSSYSIFKFLLSLNRIANVLLIQFVK